VVVLVAGQRTLTCIDSCAFFAFEAHGLDYSEAKGGKKKKSDAHERTVRAASIRAELGRTGVKEEVREEDGTQAGGQPKVFSSESG